MCWQKGQVCARSTTGGLHCLSGHKEHCKHKQSCISPGDATFGQVCCSKWEPAIKTFKSKSAWCVLLIATQKLVYSEYLWLSGTLMNDLKCCLTSERLINRRLYNTVSENDKCLIFQLVLKIGRLLDRSFCKSLRLQKALVMPSPAMFLSLLGYTWNCRDALFLYIGNRMLSSTSPSSESMWNIGNSVSVGNYNSKKKCLRTFLISYPCCKEKQVAYTLGHKVQNSRLHRLYCGVLSF